MRVEKLERKIGVVDVPTGYQGPEHMQHIEDIVKFVEESPYVVLPCGAYFGMKQSLEEAKGDPMKMWSRAGYHFKFWFDCIYSGMEFARMAGGEFKIIVPEKTNESERSTT